jgi:hypothetical protein
MNELYGHHAEKSESLVDKYLKAEPKAMVVGQLEGEE